MSEKAPRRAYTRRNNRSLPAKLDTDIQNSNQKVTLTRAGSKSEKDKKPVNKPETLMSKIPETEPVVSLKVAQAREANIIKTMGAEAASKLQVMAAQNRELAELLKEARDELDLLKAGQQGALSPNEEPEGKKIVEAVTNQKEVSKNRSRAWNRGSNRGRGHNKSLCRGRAVYQQRNQYHWPSVSPSSGTMMPIGASYPPVQHMVFPSASQVAYQPASQIPYPSAPLAAASTLGNAPPVSLAPFYTRYL